MNNGFIKVDRDIQQSEIWYDPLLLRLWLWCLMKARYTPGNIFIDGKKIDLEVGQFITGRTSIEQEFNLGLRGKYFFEGGKLMYNLKKLESLNQIKIKTTNKYSLVTVYSVISDVENSNQNENKFKTTSKQLHTKEEGSKKEKESSKNKDYIVEIINHLNIKTNSKYSPKAKETVTILNRALQTYSVEDLKNLIDNMVEAWTGTKWETYLRPSTLFRASNIENYLNYKTFNNKEKTEVNESYGSKYARVL